MALFDKFKNGIIKSKYHIVAFVLPVIVWLVIFAIWGQYPFGDRTLLIWDADYQYVSFLAKWHDILHGRAGLFYSLSDSIGGNAYSIGAYYYMFSPLNLLVFFFEKENLYKCFFLVFLIKIGFMGTSFFTYLDYRHGGKHQIAAFPVTIAYTVNAYIVAYLFNTMWLDALMLLPMVIMGIDRILSGKDEECILDRYLVMFIFFCVVTNFYTSVIIAIFATSYFGIGAAIHCRENLIKKCKRFIGSMAAGIGMSGFVIFPCFVAMMGGSRFSGDIDMSYVNDGVLGNFLWGSMPEDQITLGIPLYYCGFLVIILAIIYFFSKKVEFAHKVSYGMLLAELFLSARFKALDVVWGLGHESSGCPYRYSFVISFILCVIASDALIVLLSEKSWMPIACIAATVIISADLVSNAIDFYGRSTQHMSRGAAEYTRNSLWLQNVLAGAERDDKYRTEYGYYPNILMNNIPFYLNTHGVSAYSSMEENKKVNVVEKLGYVGSYDGYHLEFNERNTAASKALLGLKYLMTGNEYEQLKLLSEIDELKLYEADMAFPMAFLAKESLVNVNSSDYRDYFSWMNALYSEIYEKEIQIFVPLEIVSVDVADGEIDGSPTSFTALSDGTLIVINLQYKGDGEKTAYLRYGLDDKDAPRFDAYLNGDDVEVESQDNMVKFLGNVDRDSTLILAITLDEGMNFDIDRLGICVENEDAVREVCDFVGTQVSDFKIHSDGNLEFTADASETESVAVVSIPNDLGWTAYVDGKRAGDVADVIDGLMGIRVPAGTHQIHLKYHPPGLNLGLIISAIFFIMCYMGMHRKPGTLY